jgi:hypothetical protein
LKIKKKIHFFYIKLISIATGKGMEGYLSGESTNSDAAW